MLHVHFLKVSGLNSRSWARKLKGAVRDNMGQIAAKLKKLFSQLKWKPKTSVNKGMLSKNLGEFVINSDWNVFD